MTLEERLQLGQELELVLHAELKRRGLQHKLGATVIVHEADLQKANPEMALVSTCQTRIGTRQVLLHALYASLERDGATVDNVQELAEAELRTMLDLPADGPT